MNNILLPEEMKNAENFNFEKGVSYLKMMEKAGTAVALEVDKLYEGADILVVCGTHNNGGDGYVAARKLLEKGHNVTCFKIGGEMTENCKINYEKFTGNVIENLENVKVYDVIIDAIFGTGIDREVKGEYLKMILYINSTKAFKVSVDIPSGINALNGIVMGQAVKSDLTIALGEYKTGNFLNDAFDYSKKTISRKIGITLPEKKYIFKYENKNIKNYFPKRKRNVNKGNFGRCSLIAGSYEFSGAGILSSNALCALKLGAGYSNICIPSSLYSVYAGVVPECTITLLKDKVGEIEYDRMTLKSICDISQSICIGMGVKCSEELYKTLKFLIKNFKGRMLIDADGLNALSEYGVEILKDKKCDIVLTPHIKEFSRLTKKTVAEIQNDSINLAKEFAKEYNITLLLKSSVSIITDGENTCFNIKGTPAMAKGGSGDVLSGIIGGLMARGLSVFEAAVSGAYIFGVSGELAVKKSNEYSLIASEIITEIPAAINMICE